MFGALPPFEPQHLSLFIIASLWGLAWKGFALWRAAKEGNSKWFVALLVVNAAGLLEVLYLLKMRKERWLLWPLLASAVMFVSLLYYVVTAVSLSPPSGNTGPVW